MSDQHTQSVTVKRKTKKKSGYIVRCDQDEGDVNEYYIDEVPPKARVNVDDKIVAINGVRKDDFADEHEANELIESVQLVIVPQAELEEYDRKKALEDGDDNDGAIISRDNEVSTIFLVVIIILYMLGWIIESLRSFLWCISF